MTTDTDNLEALLSLVDEDVTVERPVKGKRGKAAQPSAPSGVSARAMLPRMHQGDPEALEKVDRILGSEELSLEKGWMKFHHMELVKSASKVRELVDRAIQVGHVALDTETQGLDTRIEYDEAGRPRTRHSIIGYCIGLEGEGYYIPVRHKPDDCYDLQPNVDSVEQTEAEITRLCQAAQPVLKQGRDILGAKEADFEVPPRVIIEFWHAKFDQEMLYPVTGIDLWNPFSFEDGMLQVYALCSEDDQGLKENAKLKLPPAVDPVTKEEHPYEMIEYEQLFVKGTKKSQRKLERLMPVADGEGHNVVLYACSDGICTNLLCGLLGPLIKKAKGLAQRFYTIEKQVAQVVRIIERTRVLINKGEIATLLEEAERELLACEEFIRKQAIALGFPDDFNPASTPQLAEFLFGDKGIWKGPKPEKTAKGQYKTDEKTIEHYAKSANAPEAFTVIVKHRQINKIRGTYLKNLANNTDALDQLRLNFMQTGAATGRFTGPKGDPKQGYAGIPIQGIPAKEDPKKPKVAHSLRRMFIARPGYVIVKVDYASQELRIAASTSGEPKWIAEYEKEAQTGEAADLHWLTAQAFYPGLTKESPDHKLKRGQGKTANFALIYGGGVGAVQRATGCDQVEGARMKEAFDHSVPVFSRWVRGQKDSVKRDHGVYTAFKRFISIPDATIGRDEVIRRLRRTEAKKQKLTEEQARELKFSEAVVGKEVKKARAACERKATNYPIQGAGADILKVSLVFLLRELFLRGWLKIGGGDDSVRIIMTIHDEIVFEIREERVAEALPVITKIMEHPYRLVRWKVPLVAEAEIGPSWAAKLKWGDLLKGKVARPPYLEGVEINLNPHVLVIDGMDSSEASKPLPPPPVWAPVVTPSLAPAPAPAASEGSVPLNGQGSAALARTEPPVPAPPSAPVNGNGSSNGTPRRVASFKLKRLYLDRKAVIEIAGACSSAVVEGMKRDDPDQEMVIEILIGSEDQNVLLWPAEEGYRVHVQELETNLRRLGVFDSMKVREVHA